MHQIVGMEALTKTCNASMQLYRLNNNSKSLRDFLIEKAYNNMLMKDKRYYYIHNNEIKSSEQQFAIDAVYNKGVSAIMFHQGT